MGIDPRVQITPNNQRPAMDMRSMFMAGEQENHDAFVSHFTREVGQYGRVAVVNLVDQVGKEKSLSDALLHHIVSYNDENLVYIAFDFHEYCRGMRFENVSILVDSIKDVIKDVRYCWVDKKGLICAQAGVFRVNCVDCLDRTNVVQSAIARVMLETQCRKLGLLPPDEELPVKFRFLYQQMWANNGDAISRQYAGTAALKGDFTRTGERKFTGLMKDGVNSANRYYRNQFKDIYRQATIDLLLGVTSSEELNMVVSNSGNTNRGDVDEEDFVLVEKEENMKTLIDEWKKMLISEPEACLGSWGLIDCDPVTGDPTQQDMDIILLLSQRAYYIANYDDEIDTVTSYQKINLENLEKIELGPAPSIFKSKHVCIRVWYRHDGEPGFFHMFRTTNTRLFNNIVIAIKNEEESRESLRAVCESFSAAQKLMDIDLDIIDTKLDRKKSKQHPNVINVASHIQTSTWSRWSPLSRDVSNLSTGAVSPFDRIKPPPGLNIAKLGRTFADLNPIRKVKFGRLRAPRMPGFVPAVWYSKNDDNHASDDEKKNSLERARILKGDHIVSGDEVFNDTVVSGQRLMPHDFNDGDDISIGDVDLGWEPTSDANAEVILTTCGILATSSEQVLSAILKDRPRDERTVEELYLMRRAQRQGQEVGNPALYGSTTAPVEQIAHISTAATNMRPTQPGVLPGNPHQPVKGKTKSVDLIEQRRKRHYSSADLYEKKRPAAAHTAAELQDIINDGRRIAQSAARAAAAVNSTTDLNQNAPASAVFDGSWRTRAAAYSKPNINNMMNPAAAADHANNVGLPPGGHINNAPQFSIGAPLHEETTTDGFTMISNGAMDHHVGIPQVTPGAPVGGVSVGGGSQIMDTMPGLTPNDEIKNFTTTNPQQQYQQHQQQYPLPHHQHQQHYQHYQQQQHHQQQQQQQQQQPITGEQDGNLPPSRPPRHPKIQMIHPSMKLSFSDTSLSQTLHDMEQLDVDLNRVGQNADGSGALLSSFSKLRVKMSNLAIPGSAQNAQAKRSAAQTMALENKYLSELRFKECKTRIILL